MSRKVTKIIKHITYTWTCPNCDYRDGNQFDPCHDTPYRKGREVTCQRCDFKFMISRTGLIPDEPTNPHDHTEMMRDDGPQHTMKNQPAYRGEDE
jgi:hypothetical protein